jgi:hypothetical protein
MTTEPDNYVWKRKYSSDAMHTMACLSLSDGVIDTCLDQPDEPALYINPQLNWDKFPITSIDFDEFFPSSTTKPKFVDDEIVKDPSARGHIESLKTFVGSFRWKDEEVVEPVHPSHQYGFINEMFNKYCEQDYGFALDDDNNNRVFVSMFPAPDNGIVIYFLGLLGSYFFFIRGENVAIVTDFGCHPVIVSSFLSFYNSDGSYSFPINDPFPFGRRNYSSRSGRVRKLGPVSKKNPESFVIEPISKQAAAHPLCPFGAHMKFNEPCYVEDEILMDRKSYATMTAQELVDFGVRCVDEFTKDMHH